MKRVLIPYGSRGAVSSVLQKILCDHGVVLSVDDVKELAASIDYHVMAFGQTARGFTPDQWAAEVRQKVEIIP